MVAFYQQHVFFCTNQRSSGKNCCGQQTGEAAATWLREQLVALEKHGKDKIRVSMSGCLGRCRSGPCMLVYPQGRWYRYRDQADLQQLLQTVLLEGKTCPGLEIPCE